MAQGSRSAKTRASRRSKTNSRMRSSALRPEAFAAPLARALTAVHIAEPVAYCLSVVIAAGPLPRQGPFHRAYPLTVLRDQQPLASAQSEPAPRSRRPVA